MVLKGNPLQIRRFTKRLFLAAVVVGVLQPFLHASLAGAVPGLVANRQILVLAKALFYGFRKGVVDRSRLDSDTSRELTPSMVQREGARLRSFGSPTRFAFLRSEPVGNAAGYDFIITFRTGRILIESIALDASGKIEGIDFRSFVPRRSTV